MYGIQLRHELGKDLLGFVRLWIFPVFNKEVIDQFFEHVNPYLMYMYIHLYPYISIHAFMLWGFLYVYSGLNKGPRKS